MSNDYTLQRDQTGVSGTDITNEGNTGVDVAGVGAAGGKGIGSAGEIAGKIRGGPREGDVGTSDRWDVEMRWAFPGEEAALRRFIKQHLQMPEEQGAGARVKVMVRFAVEKDGHRSACVVVKSGGIVFDAEVLRVVSEMPELRPGIRNGRPVPVYFVLLVTFMRGED